MAGWHTILKPQAVDDGEESEPISIEIGPEIAIHVKRVGQVAVHVSVVAPNDMKITRRAPDSSRVAD